MADPLSDERRAEMRERVALLDNEYGCYDKLHRAFARDVLTLLAEVDRLCVELADLRGCGDCMGTGEVGNDDLQCTRCGGTGEIDPEAERDRPGADLAALRDIVTGTALLGADDAVGMVRALTEHLAASGAISADQAERVNTGLDKQEAEADRLRTENADLQTKANRYLDRIDVLARKHSRAAAREGVLRQQREQLSTQLERLREDLAKTLGSDHLDGRG